MDNDQFNPTHYHPRRAIDGNDYLDIRMITLEERYAAQWKKDARKEGHRKGLPLSIVKTGSVRYPEAYAAIVNAVQNGNTSVADIVKNTGYAGQFVRDRLRQLREAGKMIAENNQWRVLE